MYQHVGYQPCYDFSYAYPYHRYGYGGFPLIVVLFILLIIIGASYYKK